MDRRRFRLATALLAAFGAVTVWLVATEVFPHHSLNHDEAVYLQQAAMLLEGQLTLRPPLEDVFRPWFFVEDGDRLYSKYAPVPAVVFALGRVLGAYRLALAGVAAANLALVVAIAAEVFDRRTGLLAGAFVLASPLFLVDSATFLPYAPTTMLNLTFGYGYLRADRTGDRRWAAVAGGAVGLAFFARPFTAVLFAVPFVGHAVWTLARNPTAALARQAITGGLGLAGVALALAYNAALTGSVWVFPYEAFAPRDGLGFGTRRLLGHEVVYTPELALRANAVVLDLLFTEWVAGGLLGALLAAVGLAVALRRRPRARPAAIGGLFGSVAAGNVLFWGNYNVLGDLDRTGDGLVAVLGPYYHFDLLLPTAAFAAVGAVWVVTTVHRELDERVAGGTARLAVAVLVVGTAVTGGVATAGDLDERIEANMEVTRTYDTAYEPFEDGSPANAVVLVPDPYGDWLNHPFQPLRNDPGYDGRTLYAIDDRPFAVADAFPDRRLYRYGYRGVWAPYDGSPDAARLQRVRDVTGERVTLETTVGVPDGAVGVTARIATDDGSAYYVAPSGSDAVSVDLTVAEGRVRAAGDVAPVGDGTVAVDGRDTVVLTVFVDYGAAGGVTYRFDLPVRVDGDVRALTPRVERCRNVRACGGAATHVPETAPAGEFVRTDLRVEDGDGTSRESAGSG